MEQPAGPDQGPDDVLSMGEGSGNGSARWSRLGAVLVVLVLAFGIYRMVSGPSTPGAADQAEAAQESGSVGSAFSGSGQLASGDFRAQHATRLKLGSHLVTLHGAGIQQAHRETSATALGRIRSGWLVQLTSRACEDRTDSQVSYGVARASGRFTLWDEATSGRRPTWRSPDGALMLVVRGQHVRVRQAPASTLLAEFKAGL
jgi:hypothetical protein